MATANITTERRPAFTWLFLATYADPEALPVTLRTQANTEQEARELVAGDYSLTFAAKIRTDCPVTCHWLDQDSFVLWSVHGRQHDPIELAQHRERLNNANREKDIQHD